MQISKYALEYMGFKQYSDNDVLLVVTHALFIYEVQGISIKDIGIHRFSIEDNCTAVITNSLNEGCNLLTNQNFTDNELEWIKDRKTSKPFLLISYKNKKNQEIKGGYRQLHENTIVIHNDKSLMNPDLKLWMDLKLPRVITSLYLRFLGLYEFIKIIKIDSKIYGLTQSNILVEEFNLRLESNVIQSIGVVKNDLIRVTNNFLTINEMIPIKFGKAFYLALNEEDLEKQFLQFFRIIEKLTHLFFKKNKYKSSLECERLIRLKDQRQHIHTIKERFEWCIGSTWKSVNKEDLSTFEYVKKMRDKISHGEDIQIQFEDIKRVKLLAKKLLEEFII